jgi:hypothetical protein
MAGQSAKRGFAGCDGYDELWDNNMTVSFGHQLGGRKFFVLSYAAISEYFSARKCSHARHCNAHRNAHLNSISHFPEHQK